MANRGVTPGALQPLGLTMHDVAIDGGGDVFMTATAGVFGNAVIELRDLDRVRIPAGGEIERVPESVIGLYRVFPENVVRSVAVIAGGRRVMARFQPGIVLRAHHVAIGAGRRIVGEVGVSLGINKGVAAKPKEQTQCNTQEQSITDG